MITTEIALFRINGAYTARVFTQVEKWPPFELVHYDVVLRNIYGTACFIDCKKLFALIEKNFQENQFIDWTDLYFLVTWYGVTKFANALVLWTDLVNGNNYQNIEKKKRMLNFLRELLIGPASTTKPYRTNGMPLVYNNHNAYFGGKNGGPIVWDIAKLPPDIADVVWKHIIEWYRQILNPTEQRGYNRYLLHFEKHEILGRLEALRDRVICREIGIDTLYSKTKERINSKYNISQQLYVNILVIFLVMNKIHTSREAISTLKFHGLFHSRSDLYETLFSGGECNEELERDEDESGSFYFYDLRKNFYDKIQPKDLELSEGFIRLCKGIKRKWALFETLFNQVQRNEVQEPPTYATTRRLLLSKLDDRITQLNEQVNFKNRARKWTRNLERITFAHVCQECDEFYDRNLENQGFIIQKGLDLLMEYLYFIKFKNTTRWVDVHNTLWNLVTIACWEVHPKCFWNDPIKEENLCDNFIEDEDVYAEYFPFQLFQIVEQKLWPSSVVQPCIPNENSA